MSEERFKAAAQKLRELCNDEDCEDCMRETVSTIATEVSAALESAAHTAAMFTLKPDASIHPDIPFWAMNETARKAAHTTAQQIAAEIKALIPSDSSLPALLAAERRRGAEEALRAAGYHECACHCDVWNLDDEPAEEIHIGDLLAPAADGGESRA